MTFPGGGDEVQIRFDVDSSELSEAERALRGMGDVGEEQQGRLSRMGGKIAGTMRDVGFAVFGAQQAFMGLKGAASMVGGIGSNFEDAFNTIKSGTGETGDALQGLKTDFREVFGSVPQGMQETSTAIADLNTLTGATGETLQELAKSALDASRVMGVDSAQVIDGLSRSLEIFGLEAEDGAALLSDLFSVAQNTGADFGQLTSQMQEFGPVLRNMGFSAEETAAFFGQLHESGVNLTRVMPAINMFSRKLAEEGVQDLKGAFGDVITEIRDAESATDALGIATEAFGAEGAQRMVTAVRDGTLSLEDFNEILDESGTALSDMAEETLTAGDRFNMMKDRITLAFEPITTSIRDATDTFVNWAAPKIETAAQGIADGIVASAGFIKDVAVPLYAGLKDLIGPPVQAAFDFIEEQFGRVESFASTVFAGVDLGGMFETAMGGMRTVAETVWGGIETAFSAGWQGVTSFITGAIEAFRTGDWGSAWSSLTGAISSLDISGALSTVISTATSLGSGALEGIRSIGSSIGERILEGLDAAGIPRENVEDFIENVSSVIDNVVGSVDWSGVGSAISGFVMDALDAVEMSPEDLTGYAESIRDALEGALEAISWLPMFQGVFRGVLAAAIFVGVDEQKVREYAGKVVDSLESEFQGEDWSGVRNAIDEGILGGQEGRADVAAIDWQKVLGIDAFQEYWGMVLELWKTGWEEMKTGFAAGGGKELISGIGEMAGSIRDLWNALREIPGFDEVAKIVGLLLTIQSLSFAPVIGQILQFSAAMGALGVIFAGLARPVTMIGTMLAEGLVSDFNAVVGAASSAIDAFNSFASAVGPAISTAASTVSGALSSINDAFWGVIDNMRGWPDAMGNAVGGAVGTMAGWAADVMSAIWGAIQSGWGNVLGLVTGIPGEMLGAVSPAVPGMSGWADEIWAAVNGAFSSGWGTVSGIVASIPGEMLGLVSSAPGEMAGWAADIWAGIQGAFEGGWGTLSGWLTGTVLPGILNFIPDPFGLLVPVGTNIMSGFSSGLRERFNGVINWLGSVKLTIQNFISDPTGVLYSVGWGIISGLYNGITDRWSQVKGPIANIVEQGKEIFTLGFLTKSPSKFTHQIGQWIMEGWANGLREGYESVASVINWAVENAKRTFEDMNFDFMNPAEGIAQQVEAWVGKISEIIQTIREHNADEDVSPIEEMLFGTTMGKFTENITQAFGEMGGSLIEQLTKTLATGEGGGQLATMVLDLINAAKEVGVPEMDHLGQELIDAMAAALTGDPAAVQAAIDMILEIIGAMDAAAEGAEEPGRTMGDAFMDGWNDSVRQNRIEERIGGDGFRFIEALTEAIESGSPDAIEAVGGMAHDLISRLTEGLDPRVGGELMREFMGILRDVIRGEGDAVIADLIDILDRINSISPNGVGAGGDTGVPVRDGEDDEPERELNKIPTLGLTGLPGQGSRRFDVPLDELFDFANQWGLDHNFLERIVRRKHDIDVPLEDLARWVHTHLNTGSGDDRDPKGDDPPPNSVNTGGEDKIDLPDDHPLRQRYPFWDDLPYWVQNSRLHEYHAGNHGAPGFAHGLSFVPHDNFLASLHRGEAVLNSMEARQWRAGQNGGSGNTITVNLTVNNARDLDEQALARHIRHEMDRELERQFGYGASQWGVA